MDFLKALTQAQALLDAINMLAKLMQANTEATEKHTAVAQQLLAQTTYAGNVTKSPDSETKVI